MQDHPRADRPRAEDAEQGDGPRSIDRQKGYAAFMGVYGAVSAGLLGIGAARRDQISVPGPVDVVLLGLATNKLSRLITKDAVTTPLRAPFTEFEEHGGPAELNEAPRGSGLRHSLGEMLSCPFCADVWVATGLTAANVLAPRFGRVVTAGLAAVGIADYLQFGYSAAQQTVEG